MHYMLNQISFVFSSIYMSLQPLLSLSVLIDSVSAGNFISSSLVSALSLPVKRLASPVSVKALDGHSVSNASVTYVTKPLCVLCIDYKGLNEIPVKYPHPLALVPTAIEQLRGSSIYTKLDL